MELIPDHAPWRDLFRALDAAGERLSDAPVQVVEEATAAVACCLRYGTYFHALTAGEYFPEFAKNEGLSRISDDEMKRINIEFSSALAEWWGDRAADPCKVWRRTRAAHALVSITWEADPFVIQAVGEAFGEKVLGVSKESSISSAAEATTRQEANYAVLQAYRNGQVEGLHAGTWSLGRDVPGFVRLYAGEVRSICSVASELLGGVIFVRDHEDYARAFRRVSSIGAPSCWSLGDETANVRFDGMPGFGPLDERLSALAMRYPELFG